MTNSRPKNPRIRVAIAVLVGCLLGLPTGWLLASLAMLPAFLGLFFFMLLGLLLGATVYRLASPAAPLGRPLAVGMGMTVVVVIWTAGLVGEYGLVRGYDLPWIGQNGMEWCAVDGDATQNVRDWFRRKSLTRDQVVQLRRATREAFDSQLKIKYPPGGFVGFLRWSADGDGTLDLPRVLSPSTQTLQPKQQGTVWIIRITLSFILLAGAVLSQVLGLARKANKHAPPSEDPTHQDLA